LKYPYLVIEATESVYDAIGTDKDPPGFQLKIHGTGNVFSPLPDKR
jgi:hypothetical protein